MSNNKNYTKKMVEEIYPSYEATYGNWGWCTLDKAGCFIDYIDEICGYTDNPVCVEIGVFGGKSILPVALELKRHNKGMVYAIDPWTNSDATHGYVGEHLEYWGNVDLKYYHDLFLKMINEFELHKYVEIIKTTSDLAPEIKNINFLYIDGQHTEQAIKDANKYAPNIIQGGYCIVDDVNWNSAVASVPSLLETMGFRHINSVDYAQILKKEV